MEPKIFNKHAENQFQECLKIMKTKGVEYVAGKIIYLSDGFYAMVPINRPENNVGRNHFPAWLTRLFGRRRSYGY